MQRSRNFLEDTDRSKIRMKKRSLILSAASAILALFSAILLFAALVWASDQPWKGKPYQQWDDKDVERVFTDSPWARTTTITRTWLPISEKDLPNDTVAGPDTAHPPTLDRSSQTSVSGELYLYLHCASPP